MPTSKNGSYTIEDVKTWAEKMGTKGVYHIATAKRKIAALSDITSILSDEESKDPKLVLENLDDYADRWARKESKTASVIGPQKSHARSLLKDFFEYQKDPSGFKVGKKTPSTKKERVRPTPPPAQKGKGGKQEPPGALGLRSPSIHLDIQIHIAPDASEKQIDAIFESMAKHLNPKK